MTQTAIIETRHLVETFDKHIDSAKRIEVCFSNNRDGVLLAAFATVEQARDLGLLERAFMASYFSTNERLTIHIGSWLNRTDVLNTEYYKPITQNEADGDTWDRLRKLSLDKLNNW